MVRELGGVLRERVLEVLGERGSLVEDGVVHRRLGRAAEVVMQLKVRRNADARVVVFVEDDIAVRRRWQVLSVISGASMDEIGRWRREDGVGDTLSQYVFPFPGVCCRYWL